jgi:Leucine-rich repeat (LRR) protein
VDSKGRIQGSTLLGYSPIKVRLKPADTPDPEKKGRKVYDVVPDDGGQIRKYSLILSPTEAGPHQLLIREGERVVGTYPLVDPDRRQHQELAPKLAEASAEEQQAITDLRKLIGYSFRFRLETKGAVTFLYVPEAGEIGRFDPALRGLKNLTYLSFGAGHLGREGLKSLQEMPALKTLDFIDSDIDDGGLACVKELTQVERMSFFGSRGLSDVGVSHLKDLTNLTLLDLRNESFTATEPRTPRITDAGLGHLAGLSKLEYLNLQGQHITDAGLKHLKGMTNLQTLALSFPGITDDGLKHLEGLQKLRSLHLYGTRVTPAGRAALNAKVPLLDR